MYILAEDTIDGFLFSTDRARVNVSYVHDYLSRQSYWAQNIPLEMVQQSVDNSLVFGIYDGARQVGFARVVTDYTTFAYLADVFVDEAYRGRKLSQHLLHFIDRLDGLKQLRRWMLVTRDAQTLYAKVGYTPLSNVERYMERHLPNAYRTSTI